MSKYEEAIRLKAELVDYEKFIADIIGRMLWTLPNRAAPDGQEIQTTRKEQIAFHQILDAVKQLMPQLCIIVSAQARQDLREATEEAWVEMSELFKDFTMDLRGEVDELKKKLDEKPVTAVMP